MTVQEIQNQLPPSCSIGRTLFLFDTLDSTNTYLKQLARTGSPHGTAVIADAQSAGRGRRGRSFASPKGLGLYLSVLLRPSLPAERLLPTAALTGVAVCDAVEAVCGVRPGIKWPNDVLINGKKLCGILAEMLPPEQNDGYPSVVLGMGVNVGHLSEDFPEEVRPIATSLRQTLGVTVSRTALAAAELTALSRMSDALQSGDTVQWQTAYRRDCVTLGREVQLLHSDGSRERAAALDIDDQFGLLVRRPDGTQTVVRSGEVSVRGLYGYAD